MDSYENFYSSDYGGDYDIHDSEDEELTAEQGMEMLKDIWYNNRYDERRKLKDYKEEGESNSYSDIKKTANLFNKKNFDMFYKKYKTLVNMMDLNRNKAFKEHRRKLCFQILECLIKETLESSKEENRYLKCFSMSRLLCSGNFLRLKIPEQCTLLKHLQDLLYDNFFISNVEYIFHVLLDLKELNFFIPECNSHKKTFQSTLLNEDHTSNTLFTLCFNNKGSGTLMEKINNEIIVYSEQIYELDLIERIKPKFLRHFHKQSNFISWTWDNKCYHCKRKKTIKHRKLLQICLNRLISNPFMCKIVNNSTYFDSVRMFTDDMIKFISLNYRGIKKASNHKVWSCFHLIDKSLYYMKISRFKGKNNNVGAHRNVREAVFSEVNGRVPCHPEWPILLRWLKTAKKLCDQIGIKGNFVHDTLVPRTKKIKILKKIMKAHKVKQSAIGTATGNVRTREFEKKEKERKELEEKAKYQAMMDTNLINTKAFDDKETLIKLMEKYRKVKSTNNDSTVLYARIILEAMKADDIDAVSKVTDAVRINREALSISDNIFYEYFSDDKNQSNFPSNLNRFADKIFVDLIKLVCYIGINRKVMDLKNKTYKLHIISTYVFQVHSIKHLQHRLDLVSNLVNKAMESYDCVVKIVEKQIALQHKLKEFKKLFIFDHTTHDKYMGILNESRSLLNS